MMNSKFLIYGILVLAIISTAFISGCVQLPALEAEQGLQIVLKDVGFPEVKYLQPTIKEFQLQKEDGSWTTIWSSSKGKTVKLTPDSTEVVLDIVNVPAGTYIGTKLMVSTIDVEVDINRDGDTEDKSVEIILTEEEFASLPQKEKPQAPQKPQAPEKPSAPQKPEAPEKPQPPEKPSGPDSPPNDLTGAATDGQQPPEQPKEPERPSEPPQPPEPEAPGEPSAPPEPQAPYRIEGGLVYTGEYLDEKHTVTLSDYIIPLFEDKFIYGGTDGKITYDFTIHPLLPKHEQISVEVSTEYPPPLVLTLSALEVSSASVIGSTILVGTVTLSGPAPEGGQVIHLSADPKNLLILPANVIVKAGETSGNFNMSTKAVTSPVNVIVIAELGDSQKKAQITINPTPVPVLSSLTVSPDSVVGGGVNSVGIVTLSSPAPEGGQIVMLFTNAGYPMKFNPSVTVKAGETLATFNITTYRVGSPLNVPITATLNRLQKTASLTINPATVLAVSALTISPVSVLGGESSVGTVILSGPAPIGGQVVQLSANPSGSLTLPASVIVKAGETSGTFNIQTNIIMAAPAYATLVAMLDNSQKNASLTINPMPAYCPYNCRPATRERSGWSTSWVTKCKSNEVQMPSSCPAMEQCYSCGLFGMQRCCSRVASICCKSK